MIRLAKQEDMETILDIVKTAKEYMKQSGNATQWSGNYPAAEDFMRDIGKNQLFVCHDGDVIYGVFAFIIGDDPNYAYIEDGGWLNNKPYGAIHRIAGNGTVKGVFREALDFSKSRMNNLRIDTHADNRTMQHLIEKSGFQKCGIVYMDDGSPRIAYQYEG